MSSSFLSRGIDYLGDLGAKLRDLQGFRTLAHELVQNADDAPTATAMSFDITDEALVVDNDGVFSKCQDERSDECIWKDDGVHNHRCDFHRFRRIASGDKRGQEGTTGAFGIGFIAVYQITDAPELISSGSHWILHEDRPEGERIEVCSGCDKCQQSGIPGTRFILPWARDSESALRRALRAEAVSIDGPDRLVAELQLSLPTAMLFLKRLRALRIARNGIHVQRLERLDEGNSLILSDGRHGGDQVWHIIDGDFSAAAERLRAAHPTKIEHKRSCAVKLAIPAGDLAAGLVCACLPTEQDLDLPFHINADFYTSNDRKRIILAEDYQSLWNREAIKAAALALGQSIERLPNLVGPKAFWALMEQLVAVANKADQGRCDAVLADFWKSCAPTLRTRPVVFTSTSKWVPATDACLFLQREETEALVALEALGIQITHEDLRPYQGLLRSRWVGVPVLDVRRICDALTDYGLQGRKELPSLPDALKDRGHRKALWNELETLMERRLKEGVKADDDRRLRMVSLAPGRDGALWPCANLFNADEQTIKLFEDLEIQIPFLAHDPDFPPRLSRLCPEFDAGAAIKALDEVGTEQLEDAWKTGKLRPFDLLGWFENRRQQILLAPSQLSLAHLPIFPSAGRLRPLTELALTGDFDDPLGVAELIDISVLGERRSFLQDLGAKDLDFPSYAARILPKVFASTELPLEKRRTAVVLLASRLGEIKDNDEARRALLSCSLIECQDNAFRAGRECYFDNATVRDCLDQSARLVTLPHSHEAAVRDLFQWLGVASEPRFEDLIGRIQDLIAHPRSQRVAHSIERIVAHLGKRVEREEDCEQLARLRSLRWLPARGSSERWYAPGELYADYQAYLFDSQALILDLPNRIQTASRRLLECLGIRLTPSTSLVVKHLLYQSARGVAVNAEVYRFLNDKTDDQSIFQLRGKACLWLGDAYRRPDEVFWGEQPFGRYRRRLDDQLRAYAKLLNALEVRETPASKDALTVLKEIASEFGATNQPLDPEAHAVLMECWRVLGRGLREEDIASKDIEGLRFIKCVPDKSGVLNPPDWIFFENRAGLAEKFGTFLARNVIARPIDTGDALAFAGVRPLGTAVALELLECRTPEQDPTLGEHIASRRNEIARVLDAHHAGYGTGRVLDQLDGIRSYVAESIEIRYRLRAFDQERFSPPEQVPALYRAADRTLVYARRDHTLPWASIARELAVALCPEEDPGRFAAGLKEALAPETAEQAAALLDELGFARLDTFIASPVSNGNTALGLGADERIPEAIERTVGPTQETAAVTTEAPEKFLGQDASGKEVSDQFAHEPEQLGAAMNNVRPGSANGADRRASDGSGQHTTRSKRSTGSKGGRPFISYVGAEPDDEEPDPDGLDTFKRLALEEEAIRLILKYEPQLERTPRHNPGYDLFEPDQRGEPIRWVEVKAMTGGLQNRPVGVSSTQFECAQKHGENFWLYVVEHAGTPEASIVKVQDPAGKTRTFTFDQGWRAVAQFVSAYKNQPSEGQTDYPSDQSKDSIGL